MTTTTNSVTRQSELESPMLKRLDRFEAVIIDNISYIPQDREETDVLFVLLAERYEQRSLVITSNAFQWDKVFKDAVTTMAAVDRVVHHKTVLELNGESYRAQAAETNETLLQMWSSSGQLRRQPADN